MRRETPMGRSGLIKARRKRSLTMVALLFLAMMGCFWLLLSAWRMTIDEKSMINAVHAPMLRINMRDAGNLKGKSTIPSSTNVSQPIEIKVIHTNPRILLVKNIAKEREMDILQKIATTRFQKSGLVLKEGETLENYKNVRTSEGSFVSAYEDRSGALQELEERIALLTAVPVENFEMWNVLRYRQNQHYSAHVDYFWHKDVIENQRVATMLLYLHSPQEGGETIFPNVPDSKGESFNGDFDDCSVGFKIKAERGDAILFYSLFPHPVHVDPKSLHGGCPVIAGEKMVATKWMHIKSRMSDVEEDEMHPLQIPLSNHGGSLKAKLLPSTKIV